MKQFLGILIICLVLIDREHDVVARGGRGGGGFRGGGSRFGSRSGSRTMSGSRYGGNMGRRSGMRWGSFGAGMVAYGAMSSLARMGHGGHYGYNRMYYPNHHPTGKTCTNNEDFNGTKFGTFRCPLPGMDQRQTYCCGSYNYQYCCRYWDDSGRQAGTVIAIIAVIVLILCISVFISRVIQRRNFFKNEDDNIYTDNPNAFGNMTHINRPQMNTGFNQNMGPRPMGPNVGPRPMGPNMGPNMGPRPMGPNMGPRPMGPNMGPRPMGPRPMGPNVGPRPIVPNMGSNMGTNMGPRPTGPIGFKDDSSIPFIQGQSLPYPTQMPQPNFNDSNPPPPSYVDAVKKD